MIEYLKLWSDFVHETAEKKQAFLKVQRYWVRLQQYTEGCLTWQGPGLVDLPGISVCHTPSLRRAGGETEHMQ